jgi:hypothetical protein
MSKVYSTEELLQVLASERQACLRGDRLNLTGNTAAGHPILDRFLKTDGLQKYAAYQGFKDAVHAYQRQHYVSGIVWQTVTWNSRSLRYPVVDPNLIAIPDDFEVLRRAKAEVLVFWERAIPALELYLGVNRGKDFQAMDPGEVWAIAQRTDWAKLTLWQRPDFVELLLQLGWGDPSEAEHWRAWPDAGNEAIHAVQPGCRPVCA